MYISIQEEQNDHPFLPQIPNANLNTSIPNGILNEGSELYSHSAVELELAFTLKRRLFVRVVYSRITLRLNVILFAEDLPLSAPIYSHEISEKVSRPEHGDPDKRPHCEDSRHFLALFLPLS